MTALIKKLVLLLSALLCVAGVGLAVRGGIMAWRNGGGDLSPLVTVIKARDYTLKIPAAGELQSAESVVVAVPPVPVDQLKIATVVPNGTRVKKGDVLLEFDPAELDLQMQERQSDFDVVKQNLDKSNMAADVDKADDETNRDIAELELQHISRFQPRDQNIYSRRDIIEGQINKQYAEKKIVFAEAKLTLKGKSYSLDEAILMMQRQQADFQLKQVQTALASLKLLSPASGMVVYNDPGFFFNDMPLMPGRVVYGGMALFNVVDPDKMEAKCFVLEKDAGELRAGEPVSVKLDPYPDLAFTGKVKSIEKVARPIDRDSPVKYFQTVVSMDKTDPALMKPGVKVKVDIAERELKSVVVVPRSAIVKGDSGYTAYVQKAPSKFEPVNVALGDGDSIQVVVTKGLNAGQTLALNPPDIKGDFVNASKPAVSDASPKASP